MDAVEKKFENYLHSHGLKFTPQRRLILKKVFTRHDHFEADDLVSAFRKERRRLSRATIYRTLPLLVSSGLVRKVEFGEHHAHYERTLGHEHHDHLICIKCGSVVEFRDDAIEKLQNDVCRKHGFQVQSHNLDIKGYCRKCRG